MSCATLTALALLGIGVLGVGVAPPATHAVNYVPMAAQCTTDRSVVVKAVYLEEPGWVALSIAGEWVGHVRVERALTLEASLARLD